MNLGRGIGGFFGLELPTLRGELPPTDAALLGSGRAGLRAILEHQRPKRLLAPYFICDAALAPARILNIPLALYPIDRDLQPILPEVLDTDAVLVVDYFGLCGSASATLESLGEQLIVDQTQALFAYAPPRAWRFTSARKWFGVPDGGFVWGPQRLATPPLCALEHVPIHLVERRWGDVSLAYRAFVDAEAEVATEVTPMSTTSAALLSGVDAEHVRMVRRKNYEQLHARLGRYNTLTIQMKPTDVPFCYPLVPAQSIDRGLLTKHQVFVPRFWEDCLLRNDAAFAWEIELSTRLLPLPIDQRYGSAEMAQVANHVLNALTQGCDHTGD